MTDEKMPTREEVREWLNSGEWGGEGIEPLIDNACKVGVAYLALLDERDRLREEVGHNKDRIEKLEKDGQHLYMVHHCNCRDEEEK